MESRLSFRSPKKLQLAPVLSLRYQGSTAREELFPINQLWRMSKKTLGFNHKPIFQVTFQTN